MQRILSVIAMVLVSAVQSGVYAQQSDLTQNPGLKRFNTDSELAAKSGFDIKNVRVGDNVLAKTIVLQEQGGDVKYISGNNRSRQVTVVFERPYQNSSLLQNLILDFDKDKGFITTVTLNYKIDSIYIDILPVYERVLEQAMAKYGTPLTLAQVRDVAGQPEESVRLQTFVDKLSPEVAVSEQVKEYLLDKVVTRRTAFEQDEKGNALLITGFRQCYYWPRKNYAELVSLCAFRPSSGNMKGQGIELKLVNFTVQQSISRFNEQTDLSDIDF